MIYYVDIHAEDGQYIVIPHASQGINNAGSGPSHKTAIESFKKANNLPADSGVKVAMVQYS